MSIKKTLIPLLFLAFSVSLFAQTESKEDSLSVKKDNPLYQFQDLKQSKTTTTATAPTIATSDKEASISEEERRRKLFLVQAMHFLTPQWYVGPSNSDYNKGYRSKLLTFTHDYTFQNGHNLGNDVFLQTLSTKKTYTGMGALSLISADMYYQPLSWLTLSGGMYTAKYSMIGPGHLLHFNDMGFNASMRFKLHDRVYLRAHGMYSINSNDKDRNFKPSMMGLYPQTYFGGGVEFKVTEKFGVEGGMVRELNPMNGKWKNVPYIMPIFYGIGVGR